MSSKSSPLCACVPLPALKQTEHGYEDGVVWEKQQLKAPFPQLLFHAQRHNLGSYADLSLSSPGTSVQDLPSGLIGTVTSAIHRTPILIHSHLPAFSSASLKFLMSLFQCQWAWGVCRGIGWQPALMCLPGLRNMLTFSTFIVVYTIFYVQRETGIHCASGIHGPTPQLLFCFVFFLGGGPTALGGYTNNSLHISLFSSFDEKKHLVPKQQS